MTVKLKLGGWVGISQGVRGKTVNKGVAGVYRLRVKQPLDPEGCIGSAEGAGFDSEDNRRSSNICQ